jgi:hypothetical protein
MAPAPVALLDYPATLACRTRQPARSRETTTWRAFRVSSEQHAVEYCTDKNHGLFVLRPTDEPTPA